MGEENSKLLDMHNEIKEIQNAYWKAYKDFANSGDVKKYNGDTDVITKKICNLKDKELAKILKSANDYFICGWAIIVNEMKGLL